MMASGAASSVSSSIWTSGYDVAFLFLDKVIEIALFIIKEIGAVFSTCFKVGHSNPQIAASMATPSLLSKLMVKRDQLNQMGLAFFQDDAPNINGKSFEDILQFSDAELERNHSYIQWLFINFVVSGPNPRSPIFTQEIITAFKTDSAIQEKLMRAFDRMLQFYGLERTTEEETVKIQCANDLWEERKKEWVKGGFPHNHLRMTRIMICLMATGFEAEAQAFHHTLLDIIANNPDIEKTISPKTLNTWKAAIDPTHPRYKTFNHDNI